MPLLGQLGEFVGGFNSESDKIRQENTRQADISQQRDTKVFEALANADDPDVRAAAVTGLLTGNHPARGLDKWFGKTAEHPAYEQIKGLVNEGHQPFMDPTKRAAATKSAEIDAAMSAAGGHGVTFNDPEKKRIVMSAVGAAPPRMIPKQTGTLKHQDGTEEAGSYDPESGMYYDQYENPIYDVSSFTYHGRAAGGTGATGHTTKTVADKDSPTGYSYVRYDDKMAEIGRTKNAPAPSSSTPSYAQAPQPGYVFNTKTGTYEPSKGEPGAGSKPETPSQSAEALRAIEQRIVQMHPAPKASQFLPVTPEAEAKHRADMDAEAKHYGYADYAALQKAIADATTQVGASVATPPPAAPTPQPTTGRKVPTGAKGKGGLDIDAIRAQLKKDHG